MPFISIKPLKNQANLFQFKNESREIGSFLLLPKIRNTQEQLKDAEGFKAKLKKDTSYKGLWNVRFVLKDYEKIFKMGIEVLIILCTI